MNRRHFLHGLCALPFTPLLCLDARPARAASPWEEERISDQLKALALDAGGRLGVSLHHPQRGQLYSLNGDQRFALCSTFKVILVGAVLHKSMAEPGLLQKTLPVTAKDILSHAPLTKPHTGKSMSVEQLCAAALLESDNTAANLLIHLLGGPQSVRSFAWGTLGDSLFRLDRDEPTLNDVAPRETHDTTTPNAMSASVCKLVLGTVLQEPQRQQLQDWLKQCRTGTQRIRAGVPASWQVGNRSGTGPYGTTNDVAVLWPPKADPVVLALYYTQDSPRAPQNELLLAKAAKLMCTYRW